MKTYSIVTVEPTPSMSTKREIIKVETYAQAVQKAHESWKETRRFTSLRDGENGMHSWHTINGDGLAKDENFNSGIPSTQIIK